MWFIFVLPIAFAGAASALLGLINGGTILVVTVAADQWQRQRGYKPGEGIFTDREGAHVYGLRVREDSSDSAGEQDNLGPFLSGMVGAFPDMFQEFAGKSFDLTFSEGEFLRKMVQAAQVQLDRYLLLLREIEDTGPVEIFEGNEAIAQIDFESAAALRDQEQALRASLQPIAMYLREVPAPRVKAPS